MSRVLALVGLVALPLVACAAETTENTGRGTSSTADAGAADPPVPPGAAGNDGRVDTDSSCFATCANVLFSCRGSTASGPLTFTAHLAYEMPGCTGSFQDGPPTSGTDTSDSAVALAIDCSTRKVCFGTTAGADATSCVQATFSAFSFAFAPPAGTKASPATQVVCTRE